MSPLGKYSQIVAVAASVMIITAVLAAWLLQLPSSDNLENAFWVVLGAIFGSFATVNGVKPSIDAANKRLDAIEAPPAAAVVTDPHA